MGLCVTLTNLEAKRILLRYSFFPGVIDVQRRLLILIGMHPSQPGASAQEARKAENHGTVVPSYRRTVGAHLRFVKLFAGLLLFFMEERAACCGR